ncbi:Eukaryotic aspartyl protease family protein [Striga hermonthica]|uniref:Eukaryotic aspartyl protease family protein n=1 Tax=Striga hermonthica TaxID=68872 RepID=A0A9N7MXG7_STRHE|nr:Eukaryotic aspartyl protease family protein [Striga hermonthica]
MSSSLQIFISSLLLLVSISRAQPSFRPAALVLPVRKDAATLQYLTTIHQRTPLVPVNLAVHLGGGFLWADCDTNYVSSSYRPVRCRSAQCSLARYTSCGDCFNGPRPGCNNDTCGVTPDNPFTRTATGGELAEDVVSLPSTDGSTLGPNATAPRLLFSCAPTFLLAGLARGATGLAGLGRARIGLPSQLAAVFSFRRTFAVCLSGSSRARGAVFFGPGPYRFLPGIDASAALRYTPLYLNPVSTASAYVQGEPSTEYFIRVDAIRVNGSPIPINRTLLTIDGEGNGGTKISTVDPYTVLESSIYRALTAAYVQAAAARNITRVAGVGRFGFCFGSENVGSTRVGPAVPYIELALAGSDGPVWTITGSNSMVQVSERVMCLGFVDGGSGPRTAVVIGGYQLEDNLVEFDLARSRMGFSSTLLGRRTTCANFNFTTSV